MSELLYAKSEDIIALPLSVERQLGRETFYNGRILTENNFATLIKAMTDNKHPCYVINYDHIDNEGTITVLAIDFIMHGHYFKLTDRTILNPKGGNENRLPLYAHIGISGEDEYAQLAYPNDTDNSTEGNPQPIVFDGIIFTTDGKIGDTAKDARSGQLLKDLYPINLQLLDETGKVPVSSWYRFTTAQIQNIDGGTV